MIPGIPSTKIIISRDVHNFRAGETMAGHEQGPAKKRVENKLLAPLTGYMIKERGFHNSLKYWRQEHAINYCSRDESDGRPLWEFFPRHGLRMKLLLH